VRLSRDLPRRKRRTGLTSLELAIGLWALAALAPGPWMSRLCPSTRVAFVTPRPAVGATEHRHPDPAQGRSDKVASMPVVSSK
jgi:hypothetical protein